jgi:hypothetical protein
LRWSVDHRSSANIMLPRIITVDPTWTISRIVHSAVDLLERSIIQVDVPGGTEALEEIKHGGASLVITAWELYDDIRGPELALRVRQVAPDTSVMILADIDDPQLDEETLTESPFIYLHRPVDIHQFLRVLVAGLSGENIFEAAKPVVVAADSPMFDHGPVPAIDVQNARTIVKRMLVDVGAMAIILSTRTGEVLLEDGAPGYLDRQQLTKALLPTIVTNIEMAPMVGGQAQTIQFFDGDDKDVFVFSVGLHHFLCAIFDGQAGNRQFGAVNRYGRQAVQDLIALMGASAYIIQQQPTPPPVEQRVRKKPTEETPTIEPAIVRPEIAIPEPEPLRLDAIPESTFDPSIFDSPGDLDLSAADDLFDPDKLADMVNKGSGRKELSFEEAMQIGVLPDIENKK